MRQLQVVGVSTDGRSLLLAPALDARPSHAVAIDRRLERAVRGQPLEEGAEPAVVLTPKEIQARLRAGESVEQVARTAGVPVARVERYAGPVLSEREQVLNAVRAATLTRPRGGPSRLPLGAAVEVNLAATAFVRPETISWTAYRRTDTGWVARLEVTVRGRRRLAEWLHDPGGREIVALDAYASAVGHVTGAPALPNEGDASAPADPGSEDGAAAPTRKAPSKRPAPASKRALQAQKRSPPPPPAARVETETASKSRKTRTAASPEKAAPAATRRVRASALPPSVRGVKAGPLPPPPKKARRTS